MQNSPETGRKPPKKTSYVYEDGTGQGVSDRPCPRSAYASAIAAAMKVFPFHGGGFNRFGIRVLELQPLLPTIVDSSDWPQLRPIWLTVLKT